MHVTVLVKFQTVISFPLNCTGIQNCRWRHVHHRLSKSHNPKPDFDRGYDDLLVFKHQIIEYSTVRNAILDLRNNMSEIKVKFENNVYRMSTGCLITNFWSLNQLCWWYNTESMIPDITNKMDMTLYIGSCSDSINFFSQVKKNEKIRKKLAFYDRSLKMYNMKLPLAIKLANLDKL